MVVPLAALTVVLTVVGKGVTKVVKLEPRLVEKSVLHLVDLMVTPRVVQRAVLLAERMVVPKVVVNVEH
jgi:hypothetical protein